MKLFVIIPSRYGSSRFEGKPLALISGKPMIQRVYERVKEMPDVAGIAVATDDERIFAEVKRFGCDAIMTGADNRSGTDRVAEAAEKMGVDPTDIVVNVQGDQPLIDARSLTQVVEPLFANPGLMISTLAFRIINPDEITNPKDVKVTFDTHGFALYFSRSPIPFSRDPSTPFSTYKHLGVYAYTRSFLEIFRRLPDGVLEQIEKLEQLRALEYGYPIRVIITEYDSPEVDIPEDIIRIEKIM